MLGGGAAACVAGGAGGAAGGVGAAVGWLGAALEGEGCGAADDAGSAVVGGSVAAPNAFAPLAYLGAR